MVEVFQHRPVFSYSALSTLNIDKSVVNRVIWDLGIISYPQEIYIGQNSVIFTIIMLVTEAVD